MPLQKWKRNGAHLYIQINNDRLYREIATDSKLSSQRHGFCSVSRREESPGGFFGKTKLAKRKPVGYNGSISTQRSVLFHE